MRKMKKVILAASALALLAGCGPRGSTVAGKQVGTLRGGTGAGGAVIPSNPSVQSANPALIGTYSYARTACLDPSGSSIPQPYMQSSIGETIVISDRTLTDTFELDNGCTVTYQYDIAGADQSTLALRNLRVSAGFMGGIDPTGECASFSSSGSSSETYTFNYMLSYDPMLGANSLSLLSAPTGNCEANERTQDIYRRL